MRAIYRRSSGTFASGIPIIYQRCKKREKKACCLFSPISLYITAGSHLTHMSGTSGTIIYTEAFCNIVKYAKARSTSLQISASLLFTKDLHLHELLHFYEKVKYSDFT